MSNQERSIMIFGAGINQIELIRAAGRLGIMSVVIDPAPSPPGKEYADFFYQVDGKDYETTLAIARKHHISGLVTGQMEKPLRLMAKLAEDLSLIFHKPAILERSLDKWLMKQAFQENNIPCAMGLLCKGSEIISGNPVSEFEYPAIIKPRDAFSSRGVFRVESYSQLREFIDESRSFATGGDVLIEEFMAGKEYSVETITYQGITTIIQFTEKFISPYPNTVELGHLQPANLDQPEKDSISQVVTKAINALGIDNSAAHAEVMLTAQGPKIVEIGPRLGGDFISSHLTYTSTGISMDEAAIRVALGERPNLEPHWDRHALIKYIELPVGKVIRKIPILKGFLLNKDIVFAHIFLTAGDTVMPLRHSAQRPGCVLVQGETREDVIRKANHLAKEIESKFTYI